MKYAITFARKALKDTSNVKSAHLDSKVKALLLIIAENPYQTPPPYERLVGDLHGLYSRRINIQHRLVYQVREADHTVAILSMWSHYEF
ncbi:MAG: Txe/YoeB family addiction module toxin [Sphaerochaeta sp.]|nr:Txe/YoeB family addiction module toxin [Sphaerochaeta sp.]